MNKEEPYLHTCMYYQELKLLVLYITSGIFLHIHVHAHVHKYIVHGVCIIL